MTEQLVDIPNIERLSPNIIRILGQNPGKFTLQGTNTYLLGTGKKRLLIDSGEGKSEYESLLSTVLRDENCTIGAVLLTHWHHDHVGGVDQVTNLCPEATFSKHNPSNEDTTYLPINNGDEFAVEGAKVKAVHTPGHTTDHMVFFMEDTGELFTGDSILGQGTAVFESLSTYLSSLKKQLDLNPTTLYPGHGPVIRSAETARGKIQEYITHRQQREDEIINLITDNGQDTPTSAMDIVKVIYAKYPQSLWPAAERGVLLHLQKLKDEGQANELADGKWILVPRQSAL